MTTLPPSEKNRMHIELDHILEKMSHYDSADDSGKHHITDEVFAFIESLAGPLIEKQLQNEGCACFRARAFHLDETKRPDSWPASEEEHQIYRARVLIALLGFMRVSLDNIGFPVAGINRDLLALTCDHKYTPKYLPISKRGAGKDDHDDRRIMARRKFTLGVYVEKGLSNKSIEKILEDYQKKGIPITEGTWKNLREDVPAEIRKIVQEDREDETDYSGYDLPDNLQELFQIAVQLK